MAFVFNQANCAIPGVLETLCPVVQCSNMVVWGCFGNAAQPFCFSSNSCVNYPTCQSLQLHLAANGYNWNIVCVDSSNSVQKRGVPDGEPTSGGAGTPSSTPPSSGGVATPSSTPPSSGGVGAPGSTPPSSGNKQAGLNKKAFVVMAIANALYNIL